MVSILAIIFIAAIIVIVDLPSLRKDNLKREIRIFFISLFISVGLVIAWVLDVPMTNLFIILEIMYKPISDAVTFLLT